MRQVHLPSILYRLSVLPLPKDHRVALNSFGKVEARWSVDRSAVNVLATGVWGCRISRATGSPRDWVTWADR